MNNIYEPKFVKQLFNQMSGSYERMNYITSFGFSIRWRKQFLNKLGKSEHNLNVIDLLSGLGENWTYLKQNFPNSTFSALDFSEEMILQSESKGNKVFKDQLNLLCEDILQSNLESNSFDIISCAYGLKTFNKEQLEILAKEVSRILKPNGKFSFVEVSKPKNKLLYYPYKLYLSKMIPVLGKLFLGNPSDYKMLWIYTENFENCDGVKEIFSKYNLNVNSENYFYGCATGIYGTKL
ncbi:class I SAM-dependent methyltransferase [Chryseobacterium sp. CFBP8996]|uniref:class I SAM-dependent methyltransferase n=1 Tax=Chryseobacterium sp. CFBP8996 TaxID=3096529 RepID=UPI000FA8BD47|nr:class I SAM-dependent methyltransferase [Chryseobacterium sp. CFBP8996]MDY0931735.1 class I SAM-dependent methyltransferase [Chryseobacterium sp. CFBP8996]